MADGVESVERHITKKYDVGHKLGKGAYGIVWKAEDKKSKEIVAIKKQFDAFQNATDAQRVFREVGFLCQMEHENVVQLKKVIRAENDKDLYMVFEFMETDLHATIRANILEDVHRQYITYQLCKALKYIHSAGLVHRDIKPANLLLNSECLMKVCDFGLARTMGQCYADSVMTDYVATRWYRAPEILLGSSDYTSKIDMWSVGLVAAEMLGGKPLIAGSSTFGQIERILALVAFPSLDEINATSPFAQGMFDNMIIEQRNSPTDFKHALEQWVGSSTSEDWLDFMMGTIVFNSNHRWDAERCLDHRVVAGFHNPASEVTRASNVRFPQDKDKNTAKFYREELYQMVDMPQRYLDHVPIVPPPTHVDPPRVTAPAPATKLVPAVPAAAASATTVEPSAAAEPAAVPSAPAAEPSTTPAVPVAASAPAAEPPAAAAATEVSATAKPAVGAAVPSSLAAEPSAAPSIAASSSKK